MTAERNLHHLEEPPTTEDLATHPTTNPQTRPPAPRSTANTRLAKQTLPIGLDKIPNQDSLIRLKRALAKYPVAEVLTKLKTEIELVKQDLVQATFAALEDYIQNNLKITNIDFQSGLNDEDKFYLALLYLKDETTGRHSIDTHIIGKILLSLPSIQALKLPELYTSAFLKACTLHDLGKLDVPNSILTSVQRLSDLEKETMSKHELATLLIRQSTRKAALATIEPHDNNHDQLVDYTISRHHDYSITRTFVQRQFPKLKQFEEDEQANILTLLIFIADNIAATGQYRNYRDKQTTLDDCLRITFQNLRKRTESEDKIEHGKPIYLSQAIIAIPPNQVLGELGINTPLNNWKLQQSEIKTPELRVSDKAKIAEPA